MTQTLPAWLPAVLAVVGVASAAADWLWPQEGQEQAHAGAGGPEAPSRDSRDAGPAPDRPQRHTEPRNDRSTT